MNLRYYITKYILFREDGKRKKYMRLQLSVRAF